MLSGIKFFQKKKQKINKKLFAKNKNVAEMEKKNIYLYKYACCTPGANTPAWEVGKAFNDSSSTNSKNRLISAPSKNCASSTTLSFNNWRARWRTVAAPGRRTKERKNERTTEEERKNNGRTEEERKNTGQSLCPIKSHQVPCSGHGNMDATFLFFKFWNFGTGLQWRLWATTTTTTTTATTT